MRKRFFILMITAGILLPFSGMSGQDLSLTVNPANQSREADSVLSANLLNKAESYFRADLPDSAKALISKSLDIAAANEFLRIEAGCYRLLGDIFAAEMSWQEMLTAYLKSQLLYNRTGDIEHEADVMKRTGERYFNAGLYRRSANWYQQAYELFSGREPAEKGRNAESAAEAWFFLPDDTLSLKWYATALEYYEQARDTAGLIRCVQKQAALYTRTGLLTEAEKKYLWLIDVYRQRKDYKNVAFILNNLGIIQYKRKNYLSAVEYFGEAEKNSSAAVADALFLTDLYSNIAITWQAAGNPKEMLNNFNRALDYSKKAGRPAEEARIDHMLSLIYFNKQDNYHADLYCRECVEAAGKSKVYPVMQECYRTWSDVMEKSNDFIKALEYYEKYLSLRDSLGFEERLALQKEADRQNEYDRIEQRIKLDIADEEISSLALKNLRAESARRENELTLLIKQQELDRSEKERLSQSLALEKERFELSKREQEVLSLKQQQRIDSLELAQKKNEALVLEQNNRLLEAEKEQQKIAIEKEKQIRRLITGIGVLMALVAVMILGGLISTRRKNQKLAESKRQIEMINADLEVKNTEILRQKDIIEQKNQAITDSIQYARRIQTAVLPPLDFLKEFGFDSFILFRPKDIVSGDFYWGRKKGERFIIAAADCTGHGVPGAFMSMLGNAFLDEIFNTAEITNAAVILNLLRDEVINALKQKGVTGETRDGMDISVCIIDRKNSVMDFAGANNPLYLIRDNQLIKVPCDKMPIGIHFTEYIPFNNHTVKIAEGDILYMFTDGYADQFGGLKGKKFMYKPFQELLLQNHHQPMEKQLQILDKKFNEWMGNYEQVDDVLVMGIKI